MTKPRPFGHYFILEKIAQGGMAEIFKGLTYDFSGLKKFIVIKRILPHIAANKDFIRMLIDEAKIAVKLSHGNIAQTFDLGKVADDYFIVMEYVDGRTVSQIYKKTVELKSFIPIPLAAYVTSEICSGLNYMHRRRDELGTALEIVHRDISPQNVILSESGNVKIVDFGVAKAAFKLSELERGVLKGKFAYMSPEQTEGKYIDSRSDIFSTGVVLWEMLTGRRLFKKKSNPETIEAVQTMTIFPPSAYRNEIPSDLDEIVMKALERDPEGRYSSAEDMGLALTKFLLRHYPEFKPLQVGDFLKEVFDNEENTGDLYQEKTMREELTVRESGEFLRDQVEEEGVDLPEDTMIVDPQELDFRSIFEEIDVDEEVSDITRAIGLTEISTSSTAEVDPSLLPDAISKVKPKKEPEEITGDLDIESSDVALEHEPRFVPIPSKLKPVAPAEPSKSISAAAAWRERLALPLLILIVVAGLALYRFFLSGAPGQLQVSFQPNDAQLLVDGKSVTGSSPVTLGPLPSGRSYKVRLLRQGYASVETSVYLWPDSTKKVELRLKGATTPEPEKKEEAALSGIQIQSKPEGAAIFVDGQAMGLKTPAILPLQNLKFPLVLGLSLGGAPAWQRRIDSPSPGMEIQADLESPTGLLEVQSSPSGALVKIDGENVGKTPVLARAVPANREIDLSLELPGFKPYQNEISLAPGQKLRIYHAMEKNPSR